MDTRKPPNSKNSSNHCVVIIRDRGHDPVLDEMWKGLRNLANAYLYRLKKVKTKRTGPSQNLPPHPQAQMVPKPAPFIVPSAPTQKTSTDRSVSLDRSWSNVVSPSAPVRKRASIVPPLDYEAHPDPLLPPIQSKPTKPLVPDHPTKRPSMDAAVKATKVVEVEPKTITKPKPKPVERLPVPKAPLLGISVLPRCKDPLIGKWAHCDGCKRYKLCTSIFHHRNSSYKCHGKAGLCPRCWQNLEDIIEKGERPQFKFEWKK